MKKWFSLIFIFIFVLSLTACGERKSTAGNPTSANNNVDTTDTQAETGNSEEVNDSVQADSGEEKILIAYFSRVGNTNFDENVDAVSRASLNLKDGELVGNTEIIANMIHDAVSGDIFLIETADKYPTDYDETVDYGQQEKRDEARPELSTHVDNMEDYDVVFIGFPNWCYDLPMAVYNFLEEYDFSGKTIIPFSTHDGSGFSNNEQTIKSILTGATVLDGLAVNGNNVSGARESIDEWLHELGMSN